MTAKKKNAAIKEMNRRVYLIKLFFILLKFNDFRFVIETGNQYGNYRFPCIFGSYRTERTSLKVQKYIFYSYLLCFIFLNLWHFSTKGIGHLSVHIRNLFTFAAQ